MPKWRSNLCVMPGPLTPAPNVNQPLTAPAQLPAQLPALIPPPNMAPGPPRGRRGPKPPPPPSDRTLQSKGPASHGLLPETTRTRTRTTTAQPTAPPPAKTNPSTGTGTSKETPKATTSTPVTENTQPLASTAQSSSWTPWGLGFIGKLLPGGGAEADEPDIANIDEINNQAGCGRLTESEDICSFF